MKKEKFKIPEPFTGDEFSLLKKGVFDEPKVNVYINASKDLAFLHPQPVIEYSHYTPRVKKLNLKSYKKDQFIFDRRFDKIRFF